MVQKRQLLPEKKEDEEEDIKKERVGKKDREVKLSILTPHEFQSRENTIINLFEMALPAWLN